MVDLTVVILTKNEEKNLEKCVDSFKRVARRFVVVDSFSTDKTKELCKELDRELRKINSRLDFYQNKWINYSTQFNWGLTHTNITTEWTMRMDADEELTEGLAAEINEKLNSLQPSVSGVIIRRRLVFMGRWIRHGGRYPELLLRIFRTGKARCEQKIMDEHIILSEGSFVKFENDLIDNNQKDLEWWTAKHNWYSSREVLDYQMSLKNETDELLQNGRRSNKQAALKRRIKRGGYYRFPKFWRAHIYFIYRYYIRLGFLDGPEGKIFHFLQAYWYRFLVDAKMYQCEKNGSVMEATGDLKA